MKSTDETHLERFCRIFKNNDNVLVIIRPDPDSIASAMAVEVLLRSKVSAVDIAYVGEITRIENQTMVEVMGLKLIRFEKLVEKRKHSRYSKKILVDGQPSHFNFPPRFKIDAVIDHHPRDERLRVSYADIRPSIGACSTILYEYLEAGKVRLTPRLATAMLYGIMTDTANLERGACEQDTVVFAKLLSRANIRLLKQIQRWKLPVIALKYMTRAIRNALATQHTIVTFIGEVEREELPVIIADFLSMVQGMTLAVVGAILEDSLAIVLRADGLRRNAARIAAKAFGQFGSAGGHPGAARASLPLANTGLTGKSGTEVRDFIVSRLAPESISCYSPLEFDKVS